MSGSKAFKVIAGLLLVIALTVYAETTVPHGAVVLLIGLVIFLAGHFAGEDY